MRPARQPSHDVLRADDGEAEGFYGSVQGRDEHTTAGRHELAACAQETVDIGDMLDHFHIKNDIVGFAGGGRRFDGRIAIVDLKTHPFRVIARGENIFLRGVQTCHARPKTCNRFRQQTAAAPNIGNPKTFERLWIICVALEASANPVTDKRQPGRVEFVQRFETAPLIPPFVRQCAKFLDLHCVDTIVQRFFDLFFHHLRVFQILRPRELTSMDTPLSEGNQSQERFGGFGRGVV